MWRRLIQEIRLRHNYTEVWLPCMLSTTFIDGCLLAEVLPRPAQEQHVLPAVRRAAEDESWRVRWSIANKYHELGTALAGARLGGHADIQQP